MTLVVTYFLGNANSGGLRAAIVVAICRTCVCKMYFVTMYREIAFKGKPAIHDCIFLLGKSRTKLASPFLLYQVECEMELLPGVGCPDLYLAIYQRKSRNPHGWQWARAGGLLFSSITAS